MRNLALFLLSITLCAGAAQAQDIVLPPEVRLTNAMDPALREAIEAGDAKQVMALGGHPGQVLTALRNADPAGHFAALATRATQGEGGQIVYVTRQGLTGLGLIEGGRFMHVVMDTRRQFGPTPPSAVPFEDTTGMTARRTLITLDGRRLADDPGNAPLLPTAGQPFTPPPGVSSINLRQSVWVRED